MLNALQSAELLLMLSVTLRAQWGDVRPGGVIKLSLEVSIHLKKRIITSASAN